MKEEAIKLNRAQLIRIKGGDGENDTDTDNIAYDLDRVVEYNGIGG
ncbi:MAG: hypothetical protein KDD04_06315 [Sinomicrobium sp.]|nr:hypothetical protein [Sinomicrobium sp.]